MAKQDTWPQLDLRGQRHVILLYHLTTANNKLMFLWIYWVMADLGWAWLDVSAVYIGLLYLRPQL